MNINTGIILENGYNTDYIYSLILALFYTHSDGLNKMINTDTEDSNSYYIQEYIKYKFIYPLYRRISIESSIVNKLRLFIYECGWFQDKNYNIIDNINVVDFYIFLINNTMKYNIKFVRVDYVNNVSNEKDIDIIRIKNEDISTSDKILNLSDLVRTWINSNIIEDKYSYKFEDIPLLIPIYLDINTTINNKKYINIMEGLNFDTIGDKIQKLWIWEIHSVICQDKNGIYYTVLRDNSDNWILFSDKTIPSDCIVDIENVDDVKKIMGEVVMVFYKIL